jgi:hypothetical protein
MRQFDGQCAQLSGIWNVTLVQVFPSECGLVIKGGTVTGHYEQNRIAPACAIQYSAHWRRLVRQLSG